VITFEHVNKVFDGGTMAVDDLCLTLPAGRISVLVGPSGCGKTTSLRMINRLDSPTSGRVLLDGQDVAAQDPTVLRRHIGYVIQQAGLFPHRTVRDNIATVPILLGRSRRQARQQAHELLERVGLPQHLAHRYPAQLSGGQQQRVGVARALAADPPVMLMDEPFSAVDPVVRGQLQQEFLRIQRDLGTTIVLVTHDIDEAITLGDQIAIFRDGGRLAQVGSPQQILASPADDFVAGFVGRDRGWRSLSFVTAQAVPLRPLAERAEGTTAEPTFTCVDSLRHVADLVIGSPTGYAVRLDSQGEPEGIASATDVAIALDRLRAMPGTA
jgi:osmoprotectant transport system ATP-binding protein